MYKIFSLVALLSLNAFASEKGVFEGSCKIFQEDQESREFNFKLSSGERSLSSESIVIPVPMEGSNPDIYRIKVYNNAGVEESSHKGIWLFVERMRVLCDPPIMLPNGELSTTPCSRPKGWEYLEGVTSNKAPTAGSVLSFKTVTGQAAISCKGSFKLN